MLTGKDYLIEKFQFFEKNHFQIFLKSVKNCCIFLPKQVSKDPGSKWEVRSKVVCRGGLFGEQGFNTKMCGSFDWPDIITIPPHPKYAEPCDPMATKKRQKDKGRVAVSTRILQMSNSLSRPYFQRIYWNGGIYLGEGDGDGQTNQTVELHKPTNMYKADIQGKAAS